MTSLYGIAVYILGDLPTYFHFMYAIFTFLLGLGLLFCLFAPFILVYKLIGCDK